MVICEIPEGSRRDFTNRNRDYGLIRIMPCRNPSHGMSSGTWPHLGSALSSDRCMISCLPTRGKVFSEESLLFCSLVSFFRFKVGVMRMSHNRMQTCGGFSSQGKKAARKNPFVGHINRRIQSQAHMMVINQYKHNLFIWTVCILCNS